MNQFFQGAAFSATCVAIMYANENLKESVLLLPLTIIIFLLGGIAIKMYESK